MSHLSCIFKLSRAKFWLELCLWPDTGVKRVTVNRYIPVNTKLQTESPPGPSLLPIWVDTLQGLSRLLSTVKTTVGHHKCHPNVGKLDSSPGSALSPEASQLVAGHGASPGRALTSAQVCSLDAGPLRILHCVWECILPQEKCHRCTLVREFLRGADPRAGCERGVCREGELTGCRSRSLSRSKQMGLEQGLGTVTALLRVSIGNSYKENM